MAQRLLDFRSDTVTRPTPAMRAAMAEAEVGDDVFGEDPTTNRLQDKVAEMLGKEAAIYAPSGTMTNLIGVRLHCKPGDEMICEAGCHIIYYEQAGYAQLSGIAARTVEGEYGVVQLSQIEGLIRPKNVHHARTRLVCLENTHNRGGWQSPTLRDGRGNLQLGSRERPQDPSRRSKAIQRCRRHQYRRSHLGQALRHGQRLLQQGSRCARRIGSRRIA